MLSKGYSKRLVKQLNYDTVNLLYVVNTFEQYLPRYSITEFIITIVLDCNTLSLKHIKVATRSAK